MSSALKKFQLFFLTIFSDDFSEGGNLCHFDERSEEKSKCLRFLPSVEMTEEASK